MSVTPLDLMSFGVTPELGFLFKDPLTRLSSEYAALEDALAEMPERLAEHTWGPRLESLSLFDDRNLRCYKWGRFHQLLAYAVSGYVLENWREGAARTRIPAHIAVPFVEVSRLIGRQPILSYADYALENWYRVDPYEPVALGNIELLQHFVAGEHTRDERWFILVHVEIEAHAGQAIHAAIRAQEAAMRGDHRQCWGELCKLGGALRDMNRTFLRMPEQCDPEIYYNKVRPWIWGWKNNPLIQGGVIYEGVGEFDGKGQELRGETGAQSSIVPLLDHVLGVVHEPSILSEHLKEMRGYMPRGHRCLIEAVERCPAVRPFISKRTSMYTPFNVCIEELWQFRKRHLEYASAYIHKQAHAHGTEANSTAVGTGGTVFMKSLKKHVDETLDAML